MATKPLQHFKTEFRPLRDDKSSFFHLINTTNISNHDRWSKIKDRMDVIKSALHKNEAQSDDTTLHLIALDLKFLALSLGEFQNAFLRGDAGSGMANAYTIQNRMRLENQWLSTGMGLHNLCSNIVQNYNNPQWLKRNVRCIYYALMMLKNLCLSQSEVNINKLIDDTKHNLFLIILHLLNGDISWMEQFICCELLQFLLIYGEDTSIWTELFGVINLNVIDLVIKCCCNCFKLPHFDQMMKEYQSDLISMIEPKAEDPSKMKSRREPPTYVRSDWVESKGPIMASLHSLAADVRVSCLKLLAVINHKFRNSALFDLLTPITAQYWKRLIQISSLTMRQGSQSFPPNINAFDVIVGMVHRREIAEKLVSDHEIIEMFLIGIRSRSSASEYNYREIVVILYFIISHHRILPPQYHHDAVLCLMDMLEMEWKNFSIIMVEPHKSLHTLIIECLKTLFSVPFWKRKHHDDFLCAICLEEYDWPHTLQCGHSLCYVCLTALLESKANANRLLFVWMQRFVPETYHCPQCRQQIHGRFARDDNESSFVLNRKLLNKMHSDDIIVDPESTFSAFKGTECEFWKYLSSNHSAHFEGNEVMKREFHSFCDFLMLYTTPLIEEQDRIQRAREIKQSGNQLFSSKRYESAITKYENALRECPLFHDDRKVYFSNIAMCHLRRKDYVNAFRCALNGLVINPLHCKLLNSALTALDKLLRHRVHRVGDDEDDEQKLKDDEDEDENYSFFPNIHSEAMTIGESNEVCLKYRAYDVIQYQFLWECELRFTTSRLCQDNHAIDSPEGLARLRENDPFIKRLRKLGKDIERHGAMNYEEYQYLEYIQRRNEMVSDDVNDEMKNDDGGDDQQRVLGKDVDLITAPIYRWEEDNTSVPVDQPQEK